MASVPTKAPPARPGGAGRAVPDRGRKRRDGRRAPPGLRQAGKTAAHRGRARHTTGLGASGAATSDGRLPETQNAPRRVEARPDDLPVADRQRCSNGGPRGGRHPAGTEALRVGGGGSSRREGRRRPGAGVAEQQFGALHGATLPRVILLVTSQCARPRGMRRGRTICRWQIVSAECPPRKAAGREAGAARAGRPGEAGGGVATP